MPLDLDALETSFDLVAPRGDELVDMTHQKTMLLATLVLLRKSLRDLSAVVPKLQELGRRHVAYGARPAYGRAWADALAVVAGVMVEGAG